MCTATYLPTRQGDFVLTSSRDEQLSRPTACLPAIEIIGYQSIIFPKDPASQGSWIAASAGRAVCLLNGAFVAHQPMPPYRHSRGQVVLAVFEFNCFDQFVQNYHFAGLEPFTLLMAETSRLLELRWDGSQVYTIEKDPQKPHIWSSATLYAAPIRQVREDWFADWLNHHPAPTVESIWHFHKTAGQHDPANAICMSRPGRYATVSLTSVVCANAQTALIYDDFSNPGRTHHYPISSYAIA
ncbi:MAG: NRDE family protein [Rudanella sp.]|nr:NRDE family protein [Rudanella sp.]